MARCYHDLVEVRAGTTGDMTGDTAAPETPSAFVWRGRLYVVREVLDRWSERRAWWRDALDGDGGARALAAVGAAAPAELDQQVWRVAASAGRAHGTGVYDLTHEGPAGSGPDRAGSRWRLVRVAD
jgi:hypothetical protein